MRIKAWLLTDRQCLKSEIWRLKIRVFCWLKRANGVWELRKGVKVR